MPKSTTGPKKGVARKPRAPKAHKLADPLTAGTMMKDMFKKEWKIGPAVGSGGFGLLYLASPAGDSPVKTDASYVAKVEPHSNGPLYCELAFYQRVAKPDMVNTWKKEHKLKTLGMPIYVGSGSYEKGSVKYRFMIMERFGQDLQKVFEANQKRFKHETVLKLGIRLLYVLQYIHHHGYVHADVKASNLLVGYQKGTTDEVYLVDYGLAAKYTMDSKHKEYKEDPRRAHDGTIEFTSLDAHRGVAPSRRGDLEILGYCLLQWLCGKLPWENKLTDKNYVFAQKEKYMKNVPNFMSQCFPSGDKPAEITQFLQSVCKLKYEEEPDYDKFRQILRSGLKKLGATEGSKLDLNVAQKRPHPPSNESVNSDEDEVDSEENLKSPPKRARKAANVKSPKSANVKTPKAVNVKSPRAAAKGGAKKKPLLNGSVKSPASKRSSPSVQKTTAKRKDPIKKVKKSAEVATQTSPGLKGLPRSRKKKAV